MENVHFTGLSIAISTFLVIGLFHPIVIKVEYYFGVRLWWIFLLAGIAFIVGSMLMASHSFFDSWRARSFLPVEHRRVVRAEATREEGLVSYEPQEKGGV